LVIRRIHVRARNIEAGFLGQEVRDAGFEVVEIEE